MSKRWAAPGVAHFLYRVLYKKPFWLGLTHGLEGEITAKIKMIHPDELCRWNAWHVEPDGKQLSHGRRYTFSKRNLRRRCLFSSARKGKVFVVIIIVRS